MRWPRWFPYSLLVVALASVCFFWRLGALQNLEPRIDQASFARWVEDLRDEDHVIPHRAPGDSWRAALEGDHQSLLNRYAIRIYNKPSFAFNTVGLGILYLLSFVTGYGYRAQVGVSILASVAVMLVLGWAPSWLAGRDARSQAAGTPDRAVGVAALIFAGTTAYLHFYSAWGVHNFGILALVLAVALVSMAGGRSRSGEGGIDWTLLLVGAATTWVAIYAHWTNLFLLPPAVAAHFLFFGSGSWRRRMLHSAIYTALAAVSIAPVAVVMTALHSPGAATEFTYAAFEPAGVPALLWAAASRAGEWFSSGRQMFSAPGLICAIAGLILLARKRGITLPLLVVLVHWLSYTLIPGFTWNGSPTWLRTYPYVLPLFCLGMAYLFVSAIAGELGEGMHAPGARAPGRLIPALVVSLALGHMAMQIAAFASSPDAASRVPQTWEAYLQGQGTLRPMVKAIDASLPDRSTLMTWNYPLQDVYVSLSERSPREIVVPPALEPLWGRYKSGTLPDYLRRRRVGVSCKGPLFLLAGKTIPPGDLERALSDVLRAASPECAIRRAVPAGAWKTDVGVFGDVVLYALE